jgi:hypothetical protein
VVVAFKKVKWYAEDSVLCIIADFNQIYCSFCDSYQHAHCYGYVGPTFALVPTEHICYSCLLADIYIELSDMEYLARVRRILHYLREQRECESETALATALGQSLLPCYRAPDVIRCILRTSINY